MRKETPQERFARLNPEAVKRSEQRREEQRKKEQEKKDHFEEVLGRMNVKELHELQCRISKTMADRYADVCSDYNTMLNC